MRIQIDKSKLSKAILMIFIILLFFGVIYFLSFSSFLLWLSTIGMIFFGLSSNGQELMDSSLKLSGEYLIFLILFLIAFLIFLFLYKRKKEEYIEPIEVENKCIKCNHEMSNIDHKCPNCGFSSDIEYTCKRCLAINNINSSTCLKCGETITKEDKIGEVNKKITLNIVKANLIIIIILNVIYPLIGIIVSIFVIYYYFKKEKKLFMILKNLKEKKD